MDDSDDSLEELRRLSRAAFSQAYRLEVMLFVANSDGFVTQTEIARALGLSVSNVQAPVRSLIECGLLTPMPKSDNRSLFLARTDSPAWDWARQLRGQASGHQPVQAQISSLADPGNASAG